MAGVGLAFFFGALLAEAFALRVGGAGHAVLHFAAEAAHAAFGNGWTRGSGGAVGVGVAVGLVGVVGVVVAAFGLDVGFGGDFEEALHAGAFGRGEAGEVVGVVVGMVPDRGGGIDVGVDEELVRVFRVVLSEPARWQWSRFVLHAAAG